MLKVYSAYDQNLISTLELKSRKEVQKIVENAFDVFSDSTKKNSKSDRIEILKRILVLMEDRADEIIQVAIEEGGKPYTDTKVEMDRAIHGVQLAIEHLSQMSGIEVPMGHTASSLNRLAYTMLEPIGVVVAISAFNHPINLIIHQVIPAIAVGCPVIIKPALTTPLTCLLLNDIFQEAGLPLGWCTTVICDNDSAEYLATSNKISFLSFIGSSEVGWYLRSKLSPGTRCSLEHGGVASVIVEPDADINETVSSLIKGAFTHAGQVCVSVQRIYVHESIAKEFVDLMDDQCRTLVVGDPVDPETDVGPLILPSEVDRVHDWVEEAVDCGARLICGGYKIGDTCYAPTIILNPDHKTKVMNKEVFGPVVSIIPYTNRLDAIDMSNSLEYSFQAAVFTHNIDVALDTVKRLNARAVMVNDHSAFRVDWMPFGGNDVSGLGTCSIPDTMKEMTKEKLMVIKSNVL